MGAVGGLFFLIEKVIGVLKNGPPNLSPITFRERWREWGLRRFESRPFP